MFDQFLQYFHLDWKPIRTDDPYMDFMCQLGGCSFGDGIFTAFSADNIDRWTNLVNAVFPKAGGQFKLFAHNWMGNCFAVDLNPDRYGHVIIFEIGSGDAYEVPCTLEEFLNNEIPTNQEATLERTLFEEWMETYGKPIPQGKCIGYIKPLFAGGKHVVENLEETDMEFYWVVLARVLLNRANPAAKSPQKNKTGLLETLKNLFGKK